MTIIGATVFPRHRQKLQWEPGRYVQDMTKTPSRHVRNVTLNGRMRLVVESYESLCHDMLASLRMGHDARDNSLKRRS